MYNKNKIPLNKSIKIEQYFWKILEALLKDIEENEMKQS